MDTARSLLIFTLVILEVIEVSVLSIICRTLLYLNLPPNVLRSIEFEYSVNDLIIFVLNDSTADT
jgi:hypothetical protein